MDDATAPRPDGARVVGADPVRLVVPAGSPWGGLEAAAVALLTAGTVLLPLVGPLAGVVLACLSPRWTRREKVVATVWTLLPGAVLGAAVLALVVGRS